MKRKILSIGLCCSIALSSLGEDGLIIDGQSNSAGQGDNNQSYTGSMSDQLLNRANDIDPLVDPTGDNSVSIYALYTGPAKGSPWPACANILDARLSKQFMFIPCSVDGISILDCMPAGPNPADRTNSTTYYGLVVLRTRIAISLGVDVKARVVIQGETDGFNGMSQAAWTSNIWYQADQYYTDTGLPTIWCTIYGGAIADSGHQANIVNGTKAAAGQHHIIGVIDLSVINVSATAPHATTDAQLTQSGGTIATNVIQLLYTVPKQHLRLHK